MQVNLALTNTLWVVYIQWKGNLHNPSSSLHTLAGTSEHPDSRVLGNHEESSWVHDICSNYIDSLENNITKAYNCRQISLVWLQTTFTMIQIQRPWPWQSVNTLARTELIKGCNPSRYSLALPNKFLMGLFNVFFFRKRNEKCKVVRKQGL